MKLSIVIIGDEILLGRVTDINSGLIARTLAEQGWHIESVRTVGDTAGAISVAVEAAMAESDLTITTGGLGPTRDDVTKNVLMGCFGGELQHDPSVAENIETIFERRGIKLNELTRLQAMVPTSCRVIQNRVGTAPIMWFEKEGKVLVAMPGVPAETRTMLPAVADEIQARFHTKPDTVRREFTVTGISESALAQRLATFEDELPDGYKLAYLPSPGEIVLRLEGAPDTFGAQAEKLVASVGDNLAGREKMTPAELAIACLRRRGLTMASAESCTGGNIAALITSVPGASDVFAGGIVSYSNEVKMNTLGVLPETLAAHGAVSEETVREMAAGVRSHIGADYAVATSGIAGPGGGSPEKPVGTVWTAIAGPQGVKTRLLTLMGDRRAVIDRASATVLTDLVALIEAGASSRENIMAMFDDNRLDEADSALDALAGTPDRAWALYMKGRIAWKRGQKSSAMSFYAEAAALEPASEAATALEQARQIMDFYNKDLYNP